MSGAEAAFVVGLISGVISIIEATKTVYDAAKDAKGQPEVFRQVAARLPLVIEILHSAEKKTQTLDETAQEALEPILESCKAKAENLKKIFQKVIRKDDDKWHDRYKKALGAIGKGDKVECLMEGILKDTQVLASERLMGTATEAQVKEIEEAIKQMNEMPSSLPDQAGSQTHSGSGDNIGIFGGSGSVNISKRDFLQSHNTGPVTFGGSSRNQVINNYIVPQENNQSQQTDPQTQNCLKDLRTTDPREDKKRIEETKGGLLADSYCWILKHSDFQQWRDNQQSRLLWIKGDPGKGKTMLLCGIVNEISPLTKLRDEKATTLLSYFFCQATDERINNSTAVLRGLIYLLIDQQPSLVSHVRKKYDHGVERPFEGVNGWVALSTVFEDILQDPSLKSAYLIIDALDECETDLAQLLKLVTKSISTFPRVKWIVSSRNKPNIEAQLRLNNTQLIVSLELNSKHVSRAVKLFIDYKVSKLPLIIDDSALQETVRRQIYAKAGGTFLWAALALKELEPIESWDVLDVLQEMPPELEPLYDRMLRQVQRLQRKDPEFCRLVLSTMTLAYRPLHLLEVGALSGLPGQISTNLDNIMRVVNKCGSFLTIRENCTYFIHQSVKDFFLEKAFDKVFPSGKAAVNYTIFSRSHEIMSKTLRRDIYGLHGPGFPIDKVTRPDPDPLSGASYSCIYWVDHLCDTKKGYSEIGLGDNGIIHVFLKEHFLHWIEALSLLKSILSGILAVHKLESFLRPIESPHLYAFIHDAKRFVRYYQSLIEKTPLQLYCSALVFAPDKSIVRRQFEKCIPLWIQSKPKVEANWNAALQTLEGHTSSVYSVTFSPDGRQVVAGSADNTVRLWDAATGAPLQTLEGHSNWVRSVAFSPDGRQVVSGSTDSTVRLWDAATDARGPLQLGRFRGLLTRRQARNFTSIRWLGSRRNVEYSLATSYLSTTYL
ncbi:MAG: hypothetical protein M1829_003711 [Trizodia sp. TS-e1964]|nr:MAG: hypothetical protein M1829_003711 [Trizodia sp. TS-e1964]